MLQHVMGAHKHSNLRFSGGRVIATAALPARTILLIERPVCTMSPAAMGYDADVRAAAAGKVFPERSTWCPIPGSTAAEMAGSAALPEPRSHLLVRFAHYFLNENVTGNAAVMCLSPIDESVLLVLLKEDCVAGQEICAEWDDTAPVVQPETLDSVRAVTASIQGLRKSADRWSAAGLQAQRSTVCDQIRVKTSELDTLLGEVRAQGLPAPFSDQLMCDLGNDDEQQKHTLSAQPALISSLECEKCLDELCGIDYM